MVLAWTRSGKLLPTIENHLGETGLQSKRGAQNVRWMWSLIDEGFRDQLRGESIKPVVAQTENLVGDGSLAPLDGATQLLRLALGDSC